MIAGGSYPREVGTDNVEFHTGHIHLFFCSYMFCSNILVAFYVLFIEKF